MDPSGLTLDQIRKKLQSEDPSKFREMMTDMNFIGEEPTWEKMELLERVSAPHDGGPDATEANQTRSTKNDLTRLKGDRAELATRLQRT